MRKKILLSIFTSFLLTISFTVKAESTCSSERVMELTGLANNVKADYEEYEIKVGSDEDPALNSGEYYTRKAFYVRIYNLTNDLNVKVSADGYKDKVVYYKDIDSDGILYIDSSYANKVKNFTLYIRSNDTNCQNEQLKQITVTVPMENIFHNYSQCQSNPDFYLCEEYTTSDFSNMDDFEFVKLVTEYSEKKAKEEKWHNTVTYKFLDFIKKYIVYIVIIIVLVIGLIYLLIKRDKQRRKLV